MNRTPKFVKEMFSLWVGVMLVGSSLEPAIGLEDVPLSEKEEHFNKEVLPLLKKRCYSCHSHDSGKAKGGLVLDSRQGWQKGGGLGAAIVPGAPDDSLLIQAVRHDGLEMPPDSKLSAKEISILELWVKEGAFDNRESKEPPLAEGALWALTPIANPEVPPINRRAWVLDPIDHFILHRLEANGLTPAAPADNIPC